MTDVGSPPGRRRRSDGEATRRRVLDAVVACVLEQGYYQASSNEIARRAGVTWGTIQYQFGTREALLLEVLNDQWRRLLERVATAEITGTTLEERLRDVLDVLATHYEVPEHVVLLQILIDLGANPETSTGTRQAMERYGAELTQAWQPLFDQALGEAAADPELVTYAFTALRGYLSSRIVVSNIAPMRDDTVPRDLLVRGVAAAIRDEAKQRGLSVR
jgi:AcrR family transcriptional regulator